MAVPVVGAGRKRERQLCMKQSGISEAMDMLDASRCGFAFFV